MSIFKKASELNNLPKFVNEAYFENQDVSFNDEFEGLMKEASSSRAVYENRLNDLKKTASKSYDFEKTEPAIYQNNQPGIRRAGYGVRYSDEKSELFGHQENLRSINFDNDKFGANSTNGFSIWDAEFDVLRDGFNEGQKQDNVRFDRLCYVEKRKIQNAQWENQQMNSIRKSKVLPYRGLGISRTGDELSVNNGKFGSVNDFYAEAQDSVRNMIKTSNQERKASIKRNGFDPEDARSQWENKESVAARTMESLEKTSLLSQFAEGIYLNDK